MGRRKRPKKRQKRKRSLPRRELERKRGRPRNKKRKKKKRRRRRKRRRNKQKKRGTLSPTFLRKPTSSILSPLDQSLQFQNKYQKTYILYKRLCIILYRLPSRLTWCYLDLNGETYA